MLKRRQIRVLVPYSRTLYFNDKGKERGVTAADVRDFETYLNTKYRKQLGNRPITVYLIPTTRDQLRQRRAQAALPRRGIGGDFPGVECAAGRWAAACAAATLTTGEGGGREYISRDH